MEKRDLDKRIGLTDNSIMAFRKAPKSAGKRKEALKGHCRPAPTCAKRRNSALKKTPLLKRYFSHYKAGKYYFINLDLKKKGHQQ